MSTIIHSTRRAPAHIGGTRYSGATELCAAIRAAAEGAPDLERFPYYVPPFPLGAYEAGPDVREHTFGGELVEWAGPLMPAPVMPDEFIVKRATFHYAATGATGSLCVLALRGALLALADKVHAQRAAFDSKPRRAPKPARAPTASAPHVAARSMWEAKDFAGALELARNHGAVFVGAGNDGPGALYMACEPIDAVGHAWIVGRDVASGKFRILHAQTARSVPGVNLKTASLAIAYLESSAQCDDWCGKVAAALRECPAFDQSAAVAAMLGEAPETPASASEAPSAGADTAQPAARAVAPAIEPARDDSPAMLATARFDYASAAWRRVFWVHCATYAKARELRGFAEHGAESRASRHPFAFCGPDADGSGLDTFRALRAYRSDAACELRREVAAAVRMDRRGYREHPGETGARAAEVSRLASIRTGPELRVHAENLERAASIPAPSCADPASAADGAEALRERAAVVREAAALADTPTAHSQNCATPYGAIQTEAGAPLTGQSVTPTAHSEARQVSELEFATTVLRARVRASAEMVQRLKRTTGGGAWVLRAIAGDLTVAGPVHAELCRIVASKRGDLAQRDDARTERDALAADMHDWRLACAADAQAHGNARRAEVLREIADECADPPAPLTAHSEPATLAPWPTAQSSVSELRAWCDEMHAAANAKRAQYAQIAARAELPECGGSVRFVHGTDPQRFGIAGPDMSAGRGFRFSPFDACGAISHACHATLAEAVGYAFDLGYVVDESPGDTAPRTAHSETAADLSGLDVRELTAEEAAEAFGGPELARYTCLPRIPGWARDTRARVPARFAPVYLLRSGVQS